MERRGVPTGHDPSIQARTRGLAGPPVASCLHRLVGLAARSVPGCAGATSAAWRGGELVGPAASHPGLAVLLDGQLERTGLVFDAARSGAPGQLHGHAAPDGRDGQQRICQ
jgi:hypothetical protein